MEAGMNSSDEILEIMRMVPKIDLTKYYAEFDQWKRDDGSLSGLLKILERQERGGYE
jgi:hypothetical protein